MLVQNQGKNVENETSVFLTILRIEVASAQIQTHKYNCEFL